jgi:hypothetical protein
MRRARKLGRRVTACRWVEGLERRRLLAAINWDGGGGDDSWHNPSNWSNDALPGAADDVTINLAGTTSITFTSGATTIHSLNCARNFEISGGSLTASNGLTFSGAIVVASGGGQLSYPGGAGNGSGALINSDLFTDPGGKLLLTGMSSYVVNDNQFHGIIADGAGCWISLPALTAVSHAGISVRDGGRLDLPSPRHDAIVVIRWEIVCNFHDIMDNCRNFAPSRSV